MFPENEFLLFGITPPVLHPSHLSQVNALFKEGLHYLYIRSSETNAAAWEQLIGKIDPAYYPRLLLPGNAPQAAAGGRHIRHVRERERERAKAVSGSEAGSLYTTSVHQLAQVPQLSASYKYVFFSPLFPSISKPGYGPQLAFNTVAVQLAELQQRHAALPGLIGLGGINAANIARVKAAGFQGAALLGALWQQASPVQALRNLQQAAGSASY
jgi:thiamine-phosphate pyrophosphorylase